MSSGKGTEKSIILSAAAGVLLGGLVLAAAIMAVDGAAANATFWWLAVFVASGPSAIVAWYWRKVSKDKELESKATENVIERERLLHERYDRAIALLGHPKSEVRMGGIYSLELIALTTNVLEDYMAILDTLCAYVRENSRIEYAMGSSPPLVYSVHEDVQAVLTVLGRRQMAEQETRRLDLSDCYLERVRLENADFSGANMSNCNLSRAHLSGCGFTKCNFAKASLEGAVLSKASFKKAYLFDANLQKAKLTDANMDEAYLVGANLSGAHLAGVSFKNAFLEEAKLQGAVYDPKTTIFPDGFNPTDHGCVTVDEVKRQSIIPPHI